MADSPSWLIKILSGPHVGAEVTLAPGVTIVGSDEESDIVLHDVLIAPRHYALTVAAPGLLLEPREGGVFCNGKRVTAATSVPAFAFITAGTTHVVVGPTNTRWPLVSLADVPELEKEPAPVAAAASTNEATNPATAVPAPGKAPTPEQRRRAWWMAGLGTALLAVWLTLWAMWSAPGSPEPQADPQDAAADVLREHPDAKGVRLQYLDGEWVVAGYVSTDVARQELHRALSAAAPEVPVRIWSTARLVETARSLAQTRSLPLEISPAADGELLVRGELDSAADWTQVKTWLLAEVPGLRRLHDEVKIRVAVPAAVPVATAAAPAGRPEWTDVSIIALQELGAGQGWIRLSTGAVLFRGAELPGLGRLASVDASQATFAAGDHEWQASIGQRLTAAAPAPLDANSSVVPPAAPRLADAALTNMGEKSSSSAPVD